MRRHLTLMESEFPTELGKAFVAMENQSNPWGLSQQQPGRLDQGARLRSPRVRGEREGQAEYLWFVGCAGSFDDRNTAVSVALARLLHQAGIDFAILGTREVCNGDPARRAGNEFVFQQLALQNIATFEELGVTKVITQCAHCFNAIANEYPQFGGSYEVVHHSSASRRAADPGPARGPGEGRWRRPRRSPITTLATWDVTTTSIWPQGNVIGLRGHRSGGDAASRDPSALLWRRGSAVLDGRADREEDQHRAGRGGTGDRRRRDRSRLSVLLS